MLTATEMIRLRAEVYRAIADSMREPAARASYKQLAEQFDRAADSSTEQEAPLTVEACRERMFECMLLARRMKSPSAAGAAEGVGRTWMQIGRSRHKGILFDVTIERSSTGERFILLVDEDRELLDWPEALMRVSPNRLRLLARGEADRQKEFRFLFSALRAASRSA